MTLRERYECTPKRARMPAGATVHLSMRFMILVSGKRSGPLDHGKIEGTVCEEGFRSPRDD